MRVDVTVVSPMKLPRGRIAHLQDQRDGMQAASDSGIISLVWRPGDQATKEMACRQHQTAASSLWCGDQAAASRTQ